VTESTTGAVYLIGPASVGKSYLADHVASRVGVTVRDMDQELFQDPGTSGGPLRDWSVVDEWLASCDGDRVIVPVSTKVQDSFPTELAGFLAERADRVVLVIDDAWLAFVRNVEAGHRVVTAFADYHRREYRDRAQLYDTAGRKVDYRAVKMDGAPTFLEQIVREVLAPA
jgi:hypothetical protein